MIKIRTNKVKMKLLDPPNISDGVSCFKPEKVYNEAFAREYFLSPKFMRRYWRMRANDIHGNFDASHQNNTLPNRESRMYELEIYVGLSPNSKRYHQLMIHLGSLLGKVLDENSISYSRDGLDFSPFKFSLMESELSESPAEGFDIPIDVVNLSEDEEDGRTRKLDENADKALKSLNSLFYLRRLPDGFKAYEKWVISYPEPTPDFFSIFRSSSHASAACEIRVKRCYSISGHPSFRYLETISDIFEHLFILYIQSDAKLLDLKDFECHCRLCDGCVLPYFRPGELGLLSVSAMPQQLTNNLNIHDINSWPVEIVEVSPKGIYQLALLGFPEDIGYQYGLLKGHILYLSIEKQDHLTKIFNSKNSFQKLNNSLLERFINACKIYEEKFSSFYKIQDAGTVDGHTQDVIFGNERIIPGDILVVKNSESFELGLLKTTSIKIGKSNSIFFEGALVRDAKEPINHDASHTHKSVIMIPSNCIIGRYRRGSRWLYHKIPPMSSFAYRVCDKQTRLQEMSIETSIDPPRLTLIDLNFARMKTLESIKSYEEETIDKKPVLKSYEYSPNEKTKYQHENCKPKNKKKKLSEVDRLISQQNIYLNFSKRPTEKQRQFDAGFLSNSDESSLSELSTSSESDSEVVN